MLSLQIGVTCTIICILTISAIKFLGKDFDNRAVQFILLTCFFVSFIGVFVGLIMSVWGY